MADFGVGAVYYPRLSFCSIANETCVNEAVKIAYSFGSFLVYASVTNLCALTLDRYLAIVHPLRYVNFMTKKRVALLLAAAWAVASTVAASSFLFYLVYTREDQHIIAKSLVSYRNAIILGVCIFLLFAAVRIFLVVRRIAKQNAALVAQLNFNHKLQHGVALKARETSSAKMIGIVVTVFLVCYLLKLADNVIHSIKLWHPSFVTEIQVILLMLNSAVNPIAYAFYKRELKTELKRLFRCNKNRNARSESAPRGRQREIYELRPVRNRLSPTV